MHFANTYLRQQKKTNANKFEPSENFKNSYESVVNANNFIGDFIALHLVQTDKEDDRISKDKMHEHFKALYPDKILNAIQLMSSLKDSGIKYSPKLRCDGLQGCYFGVKVNKNCHDDKEKYFEAEQDEAFEQGVDKRDQSVKYVLQTEYEELESKYKALLESLNPKPSVITDDEEDEVPKKKIKKDKHLQTKEFETMAVDESVKNKDLSQDEIKKAFAECGFF